MWHIGHLKEVVYKHAMFESPFQGTWERGLFLNVCINVPYHSASHHFTIGHVYLTLVKGNTKFWNGVMNLVQMNILEAYTILQYSVIVVAVEIDSEVMKL